MAKDDDFRLQSPPTINALARAVSALTDDAANGQPNNPAEEALDGLVSAFRRAVAALERARHPLVSAQYPSAVITGCMDEPAAPQQQTPLPASVLARKFAPSAAPLLEIQPVDFAGFAAEIDEALAALAEAGELAQKRFDLEADLIRDLRVAFLHHDHAAKLGRSLLRSVILMLEHPAGDLSDEAAVVSLETLRSIDARRAARARQELELRQAALRFARTAYATIGTGAAPLPTDSEGWASRLAGTHVNPMLRTCVEDLVNMALFEQRERALALVAGALAPDAPERARLLEALASLSGEPPKPRGTTLGGEQLDRLRAEGFAVEQTCACGSPWGTFVVESGVTLRPKTILGPLVATRARPDLLTITCQTGGHSVVVERKAEPAVRQAFITKHGPSPFESADGLKHARGLPLPGAFPPGWGLSLCGKGRASEDVPAEITCPDCNRLLNDPEELARLGLALTQQRVPDCTPDFEALLAELSAGPETKAEHEQRLAARRQGNGGSDE